MSLVNLKVAPQKTWIQLALYDPCGGTEPVATVEHPMRLTEQTSLFCREVIREYNQLLEERDDVPYVLGVSREGGAA